MTSVSFIWFKQFVAKHLDDVFFLCICSVCCRERVVFVSGIQPVCWSIHWRKSEGCDSLVLMYEQLLMYIFNVA